MMSRGSTIHEARSTRVDLLERINVLVMQLRYTAHFRSDHSLPPSRGTPQNNVTLDNPIALTLSHIILL
jgi:hypothetical protein